MPALLTNIVRGGGIEADENFKDAPAGMNAEAVAEGLLDGKFPRPDKAFAGKLRRLDARGHEGADVAAQMIEGEKKPLPVDVGQMIGINHSQFGLRFPRFAISQLQLAALRGGLGERIKDLQFQDRLGAGAERYGLFPVREVEGDGVGQGGGHFPEGTEERLLEV